MVLVLGASFKIKKIFKQSQAACSYCLTVEGTFGGNTVENGGNNRLLLS